MQNMEDTVGREWTMYRDLVLDPDAPEAMRRDLELTFYAGAISLLKILGRNMNDSRDNNTEVLSRITKELEAFTKTVHAAAAVQEVN